VAHATVVIQPSLEQMTQRSDVIIRAVVEEQSVVYAEGNARILTLSRLRVKDGVKGAAKANDTVTLYQVGGSKDGRTMNVVGVNTFKVGEEVVLFGATFIAHDTIKFLQAERKAELPAATLNPTGGWVVTYGIGLGKFQVQRDASGVNAVEQLGDVVGAAQPGSQPTNPMAGGARLVKTQQPLDVFLSEVRRMAAARSVP
jgi:hypothetical protein